MSWVPRVQRTWPGWPERFSGSCRDKPPVAVGVGPVTEAFGPEFEAGKQAVDVRHSERLLEELGVRWPHVVQGGQEERRDAERSVPAVASPLAALPTQRAQRHGRHGKLIVSECVSFQ